NKGPSNRSSRPPTGRKRRRRTVELTALVALVPLTANELRQVTRAFPKLRSMRLVLTRDDARKVEEGRKRPISAAIPNSTAARSSRGSSQSSDLSEALA